jgi:hypothetical protein
VARTNPRSGPRRAAFACAALALSARPARAATLQTLQPLDEPPVLERRLVELHPSLGVSESYDSNIFLHKHAVPSWITTEDLGLRVPAASPSERHHLLLDYDGAHRDYSYSRSSAVKDAWIQDAQARYWYKSPWGGTARARELFLSTIDPANTELTGLRRRWQNTAGGELGYEPEDRALGARAGFEETRHKYAGGDPALDRYAQVFGGRVGWQAQPRTVVYAAYHRRLNHFTDAPSPSRDSKDHLVDFGVEGRLAPKTTGRAQVGLVRRRYDAPPAPGQDRETTNLTALVAVAWLPEDRSRVDLTLRRALEESEYDVNQFYISNAALLEASHEFLWKLRVNASAGAEQDKYPATSAAGPAVNRRDEVYQAGAGVEYPFTDWLKAGASYVYRARFSRGLSEQFGYRDDVTAATLTASF